MQEFVQKMQPDNGFWANSFFASFYLIITCCILAPYKYVIGGNTW